MIIRILTEGQYELPQAALAELHELDSAAHEALDSGDAQRFHEQYRRLVEYVRSEGRPLDVDDLRPSELMLPPPDVGLAEAAQDLHGRGLLPD